MSHQRYRLRVWMIASAVLLLVGGGAVLLRGLVEGGTEEKNPESLWFEDVTDKVGLDFIHDVGDVKKLGLPQIHGSGVAVFDFDGDERLDLYFLTFGGPQAKSVNRLYHNLHDGTFKDVTEGSGLGIAGYNTGVVIGDVNNDGRPDVLVTQYGGVRLFLNHGKGRFEDVIQGSGLKNSEWATSCNFFDYDRDGHLDLVVVNYCEHRDKIILKGQVTRLFRNSGSDRKGGVRFEDVTVKAGLAKAPAPGLGVYCADFDGDGWPDIFIANDSKPNHLWINQRNGTFKEEAMLRGIALNSMGNAQAGTGIAVGDVRGLGMFDVYVTHLASEQNTLWQQFRKRGEFMDRTAAAGLLRTDWRGTGFGTVIRDFDHDGWPDIAVVNGAVTRGTRTPNSALGPHFREFSERNQLFRNQGQGKFTDVSGMNASFCGTPNVARGLAAGDLDGDGATDLVVTTIGNRARIYRNIARNRGHWLILRAHDPRLKRDAYGAEVVVKAGGRSLLRIVNPGDSYQCSSDPRIHYGLGTATRYDSIHVLWPDGLAEVFPGGEPDRARTLIRGEGKKVTPGGKGP